MFKALKGKAASALDAAQSGSGSGGNAKREAELEAKVVSLEKELEKKNEAIKKTQMKMKKLEETEQRLLGDLQKKEAELSRNSKQLEKFKAEGAGASAALEDQMSEVIKRAETSELQMNQSYEKMEQMELETGKIRETLKKQTDLANASTELQKQLNKQMNAIGDQESKFKARIVTLRKQLEVAERKVMNAKYLSESHEQISFESQMRLFASENKATECDRRLQRSLERYASLEHDLQVEKLTGKCQEGRGNIKETEQSIRECYSDPLLKVPAGTAKRRQLKKYEEQLKKLRAQQKSQSEFLCQLTNIGDSNELLRTASNNNDIETVKRLLKQGCSCNVPDETGFSAFKYACGKGHIDIIRLFLDQGDIQDEDGRMTSLILSAKNSHDNVVRLLLKRGADIEGKDQVGRTALHVACDNNNRSTAQELLDLGAYVNAVDKKGNSSLHYCAQKNFAPIARLLLDRGIDTEILNVDTLTASKIAMEKKNQRVIEVLKDDKRIKDLAIQNAKIDSAKMGTSEFERGLEAALM
ncbi:hypothetical protein TrLO_g15045 [Triparma laevis f. longispina]|uniref:Uncharacterized protein n=1 Tax=Triparma laevis f. longispina TaxID=1714387 RepID=A0A9W7E205_9STRA|nr:hypothetical protein TrLO_g15045 [Triparma laevis f. longispina]